MYCKDLDCETRADYFDYLAETIGVEIEQVELAASLLGPEEDFDGLVNTLEDLAS